MRALVCLAALLIPAAAVAAQSRNTLDIYVVDVEGGNGTLFVTPAGESVLIDTGNAGELAAKRDAGRIMEAIRDAIICCPSVPSKDSLLGVYTPFGPLGNLVGGSWTVSVGLI